MPRYLPALLIAMLSLLCGCSHTSSALQMRAEGSLNRLTSQRGQVRVTITSASTLEAHGWRNGRIAVSAALVERLNDAELAAVLAHEMGHMLADGHLLSDYGLDGCRDGNERNLDAETAADAIGARILTRAGLPPSAMASMLTKVRDAQSPGSHCHRQMSRRIEHLLAPAVPGQ